MHNWIAGSAAGAATDSVGNRRSQFGGGPSLPAAHVNALLGAIGQARPEGLAHALLQLVGDMVPLSQCAVFAYEDAGAPRQPRTVCVADHRDGRELSEISRLYTQMFYRLDGNQTALADPALRVQPDATVLHRQSRDDIAHDAYRQVCYDRPRVRDRVALITRAGDDAWLSINLYRSATQHRFSEDELTCLESLAPTIAFAARHHYKLAEPARDPLQAALNRARAACPDMSKRELDVVRCMPQGMDRAETASALGIALSSVATYQKRVYRRMGVCSQRELFSVCFATGA